MTKSVAVYIQTESGDEDLELIKFDSPEEVVDYLLGANSESPYYWSNILVAGDSSDKVLELLHNLQNSTPDPYEEDNGESED